MLVTFSLSALSPVDRVLQIVGDHASQSTYDQVRHQLGLDQPLPVQFWHYLVNLAHGDLGIASATGQPVLHDLLAVFPATLELATLALIVGAVTGHRRRGAVRPLRPVSPWDLAVRTFTLLGNSVPIFWLGLLMLALFYARLQWAPGPGRLDDIYQYTVEPRSGFALIDTWLSGDTAAFKNAIGHLALPVLVLAYYSLASITRLTRSACLSEMNKEYILLARAKGGRRDDDSAAPCPAQYPRHSADGDRSRLDLHARRGGAHRNRLLVAGDRPLPHHGAVRWGYHGDHGRHAADRREFCADQ
ncbi:putative ABC transport system permease component [Klebsiella pneumoniae]|uniref:Putative ABC transport system permease component n=1 Tax=Klebsiella pneumoniae TaxID=573 RepID=A0A377W7J5_KLEPN|nr:putative ABC transport system permease component [Klebsiella pneumoniae]